MTRNYDLRDVKASLRKVEGISLTEFPPIAAIPPGSRMPYVPNPLFVGREEDLKKLAAALKGSGTASIGQVAVASGLGGIGKTQLAVEFVHRYGQFFAGVFWINFSDEQNIEREIAVCGGSGYLGLYEVDENLELTEQFQRVCVAWRNGLPWLLVFDNCEEEDLLKRYRPLSGACRVLVTSRRDRWDQALGVSNIHLGFFTLNQSMELLRNYVPKLTDKDAAAISAELGYLPLALDLSGRYLKESRQDIIPSAFLAEIRKPDLLDHPALAQQGRDLNDHDRHVARTFLMSFDRLQTADPVDSLTLKLLARAACLAPGAAIPRELLQAVAGTPDSTDIEARSRFSIAMERLCRLSLMEELEGGSLEMHPLVAAFARIRADEEDVTVVETALASVAHWINCDGLPHRMLPLIPHLRHVAKTADNRNSPKAWVLYNELAFHLKMSAQYIEAELFYRRVLVIAETNFGKDHPNMAMVLNNLASLFQATNRLAEAEPLMRQALEIMVNSFGKDHTNVATALNNLAALLKDTNRLAEAEPLLRRALAIDETSFGGDHPTVAMRLNNLAQVLQVTSRLTEAEPLMRRALAIAEKSFGMDHPEVATDLNNLAQLLQATNRLVEAEPLMRRALAIDEASFGKNHPTVAMRLNNLAQLLQVTSRLTEAEPLIRRVINIMEESLGKDHPNVATALSNLAVLLQTTNRLAEAEPLMRQVLEIMKKSFGGDHPNVSTALNNLAALLMATNRLAEAEQLLRQALAIDEASFGKNHPTVAIRLNNLARVLQVTNRLAEAELLSRRHLEIFLAFTRATGHPHPHLQGAISNYAGLLQALARSPAEIEATLREMAPELFKR